MTDAPRDCFSLSSTSRTLLQAVIHLDDQDAYELENVMTGARCRRMMRMKSAEREIAFMLAGIDLAARAAMTAV